MSVGYHSGGLGLKDRSLVEQLFLKGDLLVLCTTNTLALGINLPAHTVIIKSTQYFNKEKGLYVEYERSMILQMCGRAGRPPFDDTGTIIIMTRKETVHLYENLLSGCEMVESQLLSCAVEHLNAEIVQMTVSDISLAIEWLKCSYLYIRIKKNPENYGIKKGMPRDRLEKHLREICVQKIHELSDYGLVWTDEDGFLLKPLEPGKMMTKYYLKFDTMKLIVKTPGSSSLEDVLRVICHSAEISWIQLRRNDKKILNDIHTDKEGRLRFHVLAENGKRKKRIMTREEKIFVLANDCLTGDPLIQDLSLSQEASSMCSNGCRIAKCMREYFIYKKSYKAAMNSMLLAKCLHQKLWDTSSFLLKQLPGIGIMTAKALQAAGISNFGSLEAADPRKIEILTGRNYPFGNHIKESLLSLPPNIVIHVEEVAIKRGGIPKVAVTLTRLEKVHKSNKYHYADMVVGSEEDNTILFHEKIRAEEFPSPYSFIVSVPCPQNARVTLKIHLVYEEYVGLDVHTKHTMSCEPYLAYGVQKIEDTTTFHTHSKDICSVNLQASRITANPIASKPNPLSKEVFVIEDDEITNPQDKACNAEQPVKPTCNLAEMEGPSFDIILDEPAQEGHKEDITTDPQEEHHEITEGKITREEAIFDHIRKKSLNFPILTLSKSMDSSYEPSFIKRRKIEQHPIDLHAGTETQVDPESSDVRLDKFNKWLTDSSAKHIDCRVARKPSWHELDRKSAWDDIIGYFQGMDPSKGAISAPANITSRLEDYCQHISVDEQGQQCFKSVFTLLFE